MLLKKSAWPTAGIIAFVLLFQFSSAELTFDLSVEGNSRTALTGETDVRLGPPFPASCVFGDFNGDNRQDIAMFASGTSYNARFGSSSVFVKFGTTTPLPSIIDLDETNNFDIRYDGPPFPSGQALGGPRLDLNFSDLNSDGIDDLVMCFSGTDCAGFRNCGCVYVKFGSPSLTTGIVDLSLESNTDIRIRGGADNVRFGNAVQCGDLNADGRTDIVIGARTSFNSRLDSGSVYVFLAPPGGFGTGTIDAGSSFDVRFDGIWEDSWLGRMIACGDVNGDSVPDLLMSDTYIGVAIRYGGGAFPGGPGTILDLADSNNYNLCLESWAYQSDCIALGDVNGDSVADILVTDPDGPYGTPVVGGCLYVVFGSSSLPQGPGVVRQLWNGQYDIRYDGANDGDEFGFHLSVGDLNGDGVSDWACVAIRADPLGRLDAGSCYVKFGGPAIPTGTFSLADPATWDVRFDGALERDSILWAFVGDVNCDGDEDLCMSAGFPEVPPEGGACYVVYGGASFPTGPGATVDLASSTNYDVLLRSGECGALFGLSVWGGGDLNGDGLNDLIVAAPYGTATGQGYRGKVFVKFGTADFPAGRLFMDRPTDFDVQIVHNANAKLGSSVCAGDLNGDGADDLLMASPEWGSWYGGMYVWFGGATFPSGPGTEVVLPVQLPPTSVIEYENRILCERLGSTCIRTGDLTADGIDDFVFSAALMADESSASYAYFWMKRGAADILTEDVQFQVVQYYRDLAGWRFTRFRVAGETAPTLAIGDINGDGVDDLIMGCPNSDENGRTNSGSVFVRFGGATFPPVAATLDLSQSSSFDTRFDGAAAGDALGGAVACGDVNGDGVADIVIGAGGTDNNARSNSGSVYVIFGGTTLPSGNIDLANPSNFNIRYDGPDADGSLGMGACVGDINGDNLGDVLMGAPLTDFNSRQNSGSVYVKFGGPSIPTGTIDLANSANYDNRYDGANRNDMLGGAITTGNLDGSNPPELVLGCPFAEWDNRSDIGVVYIPQITPGTPSGGDTSDSDPSICFIETSWRISSRSDLLRFPLALMALSMASLCLWAVFDRCRHLMSRQKLGSAL